MYWGHKMATKSIISNERVCWVCKTPYGLHRHHVYEGVANRKLSEKYGCWVYLCYMHHTGDHGVHFNKPMDTRLKKYTQEQFEAKIGTREDFRRIFGKSYLDMV